MKSFPIGCFIVDKLNFPLAEKSSHNGLQSSASSSLEVEDFSYTFGYARTETFQGE